MKMISTGDIRLFSGELLRREGDNRGYMLSLKNEHLMQNFYLEAGLNFPGNPHGGWEAPQCQVRGHFLGHWLSAAAMRYAATGDAEIKARADALVDALERCQAENGGEWAASIPEKYLYWIARGKSVWAPHYTIHKTFMGLIDMHTMAGSEKALEIAKRFARWFHRWTAQFTREQMDDILDFETGGMLEVWADLYGITGEKMYLDLMERYYRGRLFDRLLAGGDPLTNMHANTTIPEVLGCVRAYEVTGEEKYRRIAEAYWKCAVTDRGSYVTGGQTNGEIWSPKGMLSNRLGPRTQEHCTVYNMMRLADALLRWTGDAQYADYMERNLYNGIFAQAYWRGDAADNIAHSDAPFFGLLTYFLPLHGGARKAWASETQHFFCCHGTVVQANAALARYLAYQDGADVYLCQYFDADIKANINGAPVTLALREETLAGSAQSFSVNNFSQELSAEVMHPNRPDYMLQTLRVQTASPVEFALRLRLPEWLTGEATVCVNGEKMDYAREKGFAVVRRTWQEGDLVELRLPRGLRSETLIDDPTRAAFLYGPVVLAAPCDEERTLYVEDPAHPEAMLRPDNEREWGNWKTFFRAAGQPHGLRFLPLNEIGYEPYSVYFPIEKKN